MALTPGRTLHATARVVLALAVAVVLGLSLLLFTWAQPLADDFCRAIVDVSPVQFAWKYYLQSTGRWAALAIHASALPGMPITGWWYPLLMFGVFAFCVATLHLVVCALVERDRGPSRRWPITATLVAVIWAGMPNPGDVIYWFTGGIEDLASFSTGALSLVLLAAASSRREGALEPRVLVVVSALLAFVAPYGRVKSGGAVRHRAHAVVAGEWPPRSLAD